MGREVNGQTGFEMVSVKKLRHLLVSLSDARRAADPSRYF
jgi:hypothetical protein